VSDHFIRSDDTSILRDFADEALAPPRDHLAALAAARRGERRIDPLAALVRNALAAERQTRPALTPPARRRLVSHLIPADVRADYRRLFEQRVASYTAAGRALESARQLALDDLGCVEFFALMRERGAQLPPPADSDGEGVRAA